MIIFLVIGGMLIVRLVGLETAPPGFYNDEAHIAAHVICLSRTGHDAGGQAWPLFSGSGGGGYATPTHLYPVAIWIRIFGTSIAAFRAYAAWTMCLAIGGLFFLSRLFLGTRGATYVVLSACISPWMFQFSRLAVDDPATFLLGMSWGMYFFLRSARLADAVVAALFLSAAAYAYPSGRVVLPLMLLPLMGLKLGRTGISRKYALTFCIAGLVFCLPLIDQMVSGTLMTRYTVVGIFSEHYRRVHGLSWGRTCGVLLRNFGRHFGGSYLFVHGDANLRHSSQFCGELSWLDIAALAAGAIYVLDDVIRRRRLRIAAWAAFCIAGFLIGILPAALTWDGIPHSLRSAASWPFACMLGGYILWKCEQRWTWSLTIFSGAALAFAIAFTHDYFWNYPARAATAFQVPVQRAADDARRTGNWEPFFAAADTQNYDDVAREYFLMAYAGKSCEEAQKLISAR
jgi:hypothetical protein